MIVMMFWLMASVGAAAAVPDVCRPAGSAYPAFHVIGNTKGGDVENINDVSAIVEYKGLYHIFHQCDQNHWCHVTSPDLLHWTRLPPPIVPNASDPKQWYDAQGSWDGSFSVIEGVPTVLYDIVEGKKPGTLGGDPPTMAIARAADPSDPYLVEWTKDPSNPVDWNGTRGTSFASSIWRSGDHWNFASEGIRYTTKDPTFHTWNRGEDLFSAKANGGQWFFERPAAPDGVAPWAAPAFTHVVASGTGLDFQLGTYDAAKESWAHYEGPTGEYNYYVGSGPKNNWATAQEAGGRVLSVGWVPAKPHSALSCVRDVRFDHRVDRLVALPVAEYEKLRNGTLEALENATLKEAPRVLDGTGGLRASAADVVASVALGGGAVNFSMLVLSDASGGTGVRLTVALAPARAAVSGLRPGTATVATVGNGKASHATAEFSLLAAEATLDVRALVDRSVAEFFVAGGRAVFTETVETYADTYISLASSTGASASVAVFSMGCGWNATSYNDRP